MGKSRFTVILQISNIIINTKIKSVLCTHNCKLFSHAIFSKETKVQNIIQAFVVSGILTRGKLCSKHIQVSDIHMVLTSISWLQINSAEGAYI